jgi:hypothetical protein
MPDLTITCPDCGKVLTISEFVDESGLKCRGCGRALSRPEPVALKPKPRLSVATPSRDDQVEDEEQPSELSSSGLWPGTRKLTAADTRARVVHHRYAWALFVVLGGLLAYGRYGGGFGPSQMAMQHELSLIGLGVLHLLVILKAFEDSVFQGILCLLVPFYTLYYIFFVTDAVYLRALIGAMLICIGQDGAVQLQQGLMRFSDMVQSWIASGG